MIRTQINLDEYLYLQLKAFARKQRISFSQTLRELVAKQLQKEKAIKNPLLGLAEVGKRFKMKGPRNLALNHDYHLYGKDRKI